MHKILLTAVFTLCFGLLNAPLLHAAQTLEQQIKPYGIKMEDLQTALNISPTLVLSKVLIQCSNSIGSLRVFGTCVAYDKSIPNYVIINNDDSKIFNILQHTKNGLLIKNLGTDIIMVQGNFPNTFDGQAFSSKHYLLKYAGTFKYNNTLGSTSTVPKLKLIKELKVN